MVVQFKGKYVLDPVPYLYDERGPMVFTIRRAAVCSRSARSLAMR
jgi:hypothetical protein